MAPASRVVRGLLPGAGGEGRQGKRGEGRRNLRDVQPGPISSGTVAFFPSKVVESHKNSNPLGSAHVPAALLPRQAAADAAPASPAAAASPRRWRGPGSAPSPAERVPRLPGRAAAERGGKGGAAPRGEACRPPASPDREESPTCEALLSGRVGSIFPRQRPALGSPLSKEPPMLHQQQKPLGIKHRRGEGLPRRRTH